MYYRLFEIETKNIIPDTKITFFMALYTCTICLGLAKVGNRRPAWFTGGGGTKARFAGGDGGGHFSS